MIRQSPITEENVFHAIIQSGKYLEGETPLPLFAQYNPQHCEFDSDYKVDLVENVFHDFSENFFDYLNAKVFRIWLIYPNKDELRMPF